MAPHASVQQAYIGLSTCGGAFLFGDGRKEPFYQKPLPSDHPLLFAHEGLVPSSPEPEEYCVVSPEAFDMFTEEVSACFDLLRIQLPTFHLRDHLREQQRAYRHEAQQYLEENPEEARIGRRLIRAFSRGASITSQADPSLSERVDGEITRILGSPLVDYDEHFGFNNLFPDGHPPGIDGSSAWPGGGHDWKGIPTGNMAALVIDCFIASRTGSSLVTNPVTERLLPIAEHYHQCLEKGDVVGYFTR